MSAGVHGKSASSAAESVALGSILASVADLAEELVLVLIGVGRVQELVAQAYQVKRRKTFQVQFSWVGSDGGWTYRI